MNLRFRLLVVSCFFFNIGFSQDFQSFQEIRQILLIDFVQLDDTLARKGFVFEKTEGLVFRYKKNTNRFEFQITPKEITYTFNDRVFFLKINSELVSENYQSINSEENITVQNKNIKAAYFKKEGESVYLWSLMDEVTKKTMYSIKIQQGFTAQNTATSAKQTEQHIEDPAPKTPEIQGEKSNQQKDISAVIQRNSSRVTPKLYRFNLTVAGYTFLDPEIDPSYGKLVYPNFQLGFQKSNYSKKKLRSKWLSDIGYEIDLSTFLVLDAMRYDPTLELFTLMKFYLACNQYIACNLKFIDFVFQGGPFLNYNFATGDNGSSAGFMTSGFHFGEFIQRGLGKSKKNHSKMLIAVGFDQYFSLKGGYIGSFGINIGF